MSVGRSPVALLKLKSTHGGNSICEFSQANPTKLFLLGSIILIYNLLTFKVVNHSCSSRHFKFKLLQHFNKNKHLPLPHSSNIHLYL